MTDETNEFEVATRKIRAENVLDRSKDAPKDSMQNWLIRAARTVGVISLTGIAISNPDETQEAMDELFTSMPPELSLIAAISLKSALEQDGQLP